MPIFVIEKNPLNGAENIKRQITVTQDKGNCGIIYLKTIY